MARERQSVRTLDSEHAAALNTPDNDKSND